MVLDILLALLGALVTALNVVLAIIAWTVYLAYQGVSWIFSNLAYVLPVLLVAFAGMVVVHFLRARREDDAEEAEPDEAPAPEPEPPPLMLPEDPPSPAPPQRPVDAIECGQCGDQRHVRICLTPDQRNKHLYVIGKTRTGKTTMLRYIADQDIREGRGMCYVDPHGDAVEDLLARVPPDRYDDLLYFDPSDPDCPAFNPLAIAGADPSKLTEDIVSVFHMLFGSGWGPRLESLLRASCHTLLDDTEPHTIADIRKLLREEAYRLDVLARVTDEDVLSFWDNEYVNMPKDAAGPLLNKFSAFLAPKSHLLRVFSNPRNDLDFGKLMNEGRVLLVNLAKGKLGGDEPLRLLGGLIVAGIQQAALARVDIPTDQRRDFFVYVDEFQNFTVSSFSEILSESAKYRLNLTLAHQNLEQLPTDLKHSVFGNVGTIIAFTVSAKDASELAREMAAPRLMCREEHTSSVLPISAFVEFIEDEVLHFIERGERSRQEVIARGDTPNELYDENREKYERLLTDVRSPTLTLERAREISHLSWCAFLDTDLTHYRRDVFSRRYEFYNGTYPDVQDLIQLPPRHAFIRKDRAGNVYDLQTNAPEDIANPQQRRTAALTASRATTPPPLQEKAPPPIREPLTNGEDTIHPLSPQADEDFDNPR